MNQTVAVVPEKKQTNRVMRVLQFVMNSVKGVIRLTLSIMIAIGILMGGFGLFTQAGWHIYTPTDSKGCIKAIVLTNADQHVDQAFVLTGEKMDENSKVRPIKFCR